MRIFSLFFISVFIFQIFLPIVGSISIVKAYTTQVQSQYVQGESVYTNGVYTLSGKIQEHIQGNAWYIAVDPIVHIQNPTDISVVWDIENEEGRMKNEEYVPLTFDFRLSTHDNIYTIDPDSYMDSRRGIPYHSSMYFSKSTPTTYTITSTYPIRADQVVIHSIDTQSYTYRLDIRDTQPVYAADATRMVTRAEWGANEELRYRDVGKTKGIYDAWIGRQREPKTQAQLDAYAREDAMGIEARANNPDGYDPVAVVRTEGGRPLMWPYIRVKKVNRIIMHHTAEGLQQDADDMTILRAMYAYHTVSRGWGDLGYNYIVGQRGVLYQGRAGGDYVEGAHATWNNRGTVGISVIGNFEDIVLNVDQRKGVANAVEYVSRKYGIDLGTKVKGLRTCKDISKCTFEYIPVPTLHGHTAVGSTACPGEHILDQLEAIRTEVYATVGTQTSIYNPETEYIEPINPADVVVYTLKVDPVPTSGTYVLPVPKALSTVGAGPQIRVRLSYPSDQNTIDISTTDKRKRLLINGKTATYTGGLVRVGVDTVGLYRESSVGTGSTKQYIDDIRLSATSVRIDSWQHIPAWDTSKKYNDNVYRGAIRIYAEDGKLVVVNTLPLEHYIRGIAEVSNGDPTEKIKSILVAARGYAYYYSMSANRKYPGAMYDAWDDPDTFQKYLGYGYEARSPNTIKLVEETKGQVITYLGKAIKPWYFSTSSGQTISYLDYCRARTSDPSTCVDIPYLQGVADPGGAGKTQAGHGVGMSGIGATYGANLGKTYIEILKYYYTGTEVEKVY